MSSLVRSFASLYSQKLRSTTRLGPLTAAPPRFQALNRRGLSASSGAADARRQTALPMPSQQPSQEQKWTPFSTWARLAVGSILAAATPFLHSRWASFLRIQSLHSALCTLELFFLQCSAELSSRLPVPSNQESMIAFQVLLNFVDLRQQLFNQEWKQRFRRPASFLRIQSEVETVKDTAEAEAVAEVIEEAATVAEKVSSEVAEQLPENGRLRAAAVVVEHASKEVAEEAHLAQDIIHKVDEIEEDLKGNHGLLI